MGRRRAPGGRRRACKHKMRHRSEETARDHRARLIAGGAYADFLHVYECEYCGGWHVGHRPGSGGERRK